jgi:hypothetical protein
MQTTTGERPPSIYRRPCGCEARGRWDEEGREFVYVCADGLRLFAVGDMDSARSHFGEGAEC